MEGYQFDAYMRRLLQQQMFDMQMNFILIERQYKDSKLRAAADKLNAARQRKEFEFQLALHQQHTESTL